MFVKFRMCHNVRHFYFFVIRIIIVFEIYIYIQEAGRAQQNETLSITIDLVKLIVS
jgi:hypothetical protein